MEKITTLRSGILSEILFNELLGILEGAFYDIFISCYLMVRHHANGGKCTRSGEIVGLVTSYIVVACVLVSRVGYIVYAFLISNAYMIQGYLLGKTFGEKFPFTQSKFVMFLEKAYDKVSQMFKWKKAKGTSEGNKEGETNERDDTSVEDSSEGSRSGRASFAEENKSDDHAKSQQKKPQCKDV